MLTCCGVIEILLLLSLTGSFTLSVDCSAEQTPTRYIILDRGEQLVRDLINTPGLNAQGDVALWRTNLSGQTSGIFFHGEATDILVGLKDYSLVYPADIGEGDIIVGSLQAPQDLRWSRAFVWRDGVMEHLEMVSGGYSAANAINRRGQIAGSAQVENGQYHAVLWQQTVAQDLGTLQSGDYSNARDINNLGTIVGEANAIHSGKPHAFCWRGGRMQELTTKNRDKTCSAQAINDKEEIVGTCEVGNGIMHAILWRGKRYIDLGALGDDGDTNSTGLDVNIHTQLVGTSEIGEGKLRAFLWERGQMLNLNDLIPSDSGWLLLAASRINDSGEILGRGYYRGAIHAFLLVPRNSRPSRVQARYGNK